MRLPQNVTILTAIIVGAALLIMSIATVVYKVTKHVEEFSAEASSAAYLQILNDTQRFYARKIVAPSEKNGISIRKDFSDHPNAIPNPATFMHGLVEELSVTYDTSKFRFFSRYPLYLRPTSGPQDDFEEDALAFFEDQPDAQTFSRIEDFDGERMSRYAVAIRMTKSCVRCHNEHVDSPKRDWKLGDLRGVQSISQPVSFFSAFSGARGGTWLFVFCGMVVLLVLVMIASFIMLAWRHIDLKKAHGRIETLVWQDAICGLANRRALVAMIDAELEKAAFEPFAILVMDLVNFKSVNDVHGHALGDDVLKIVGQKLTQLPYEGMTVARIGGDEFALLHRETDDLARIEYLAESIVAAVSEPIRLDGKYIYTSTSVGIALASNRSQTARELLDNADMAMYRAKAILGRRWCYFSDNLRQSALYAERLAQQIRSGINDGQFVIYYQPQFRLSDGRISGLEALLRWVHPVEGILAPSAFLPIAEERGLIIALSEVVVRQSIEDIQRWRRECLSIPRISINIHQDQINDVGHLEWLERSYRAVAIDPAHLTFEITEGCVLGRGSEHVPALLQRWRRLGYGVSLDDFGTGFASLSHLKYLPVSEFKIDRSFVRDLLDDQADKVIVEGLIKLSKELETRLIAEGVETSEQVSQLRMMGCSHAQGYHFARPLPPAQADRFVRDYSIASTLEHTKVWQRPTSQTIGAAAVT